MRSILRQVAVSGVTSSDLSGLIVTAPSISGQKRISRILDCLDRRVELLTASNNALEAIARAVFKSWFVDFDPVRAKAEEREPKGMDAATAALFPSEFEENEKCQIPTGWGRRKLGQIADVNWGDTSATKSRYSPEGYPAYSASGPDGLMAEFMFERTGIVVSAIGANCGASWLAQGKWSCIKNTLRLWATDPDVSTELLFYATRGHHLWPKRGSAQPFISQGDARMMSVLVPSDGIAEAFSSIVRPLHQKIEAAQQQGKTLAEVRDTLLPRLVSGKLRVPEAEKMVGAAL